MANKYKISLKSLVKEMKLTPVHLSTDYESTDITTADVNRPALQLTGYYSYFNSDRIQIIGKVETEYLHTLSDGARLVAFEKLFSHNLPAVILTHEVECFSECLSMAQKYNCSLFCTKEDTSEFQAKLITSLHRHLAPRSTIHGVLVEVYGEGLLIMGDSGIGKSEAALELVKRGHRLVADDAVEIRKLGEEELLGMAPEMIRYYMEVRGIGLVNVRYLYGVSAVKPFTHIDMVVKLEKWVNGKAYDRLGLDEEKEIILDTPLPCITVPVVAGRNLAVIMELAAMNNRQKKMGYNSAEMFVAAHDSAMK